jgi:hypothetical protein
MRITVVTVIIATTIVITGETRSPAETPGFLPFYLHRSRLVGGEADPEGHHLTFVEFSSSASQMICIRSE